MAELYPSENSENQSSFEPQKPPRFIPLAKPIKAPVKKADEIAELLKLARTDGNKDKREIEFGVVPNHQGQLINEQTAIKTNGFKKTASREAFEHTIKRHGNDSVERELNQKGVEDADFYHIPNILVSPDKVAYGGKNRFEQDVILFIKKINGFEYYVAMSVRGGKRTELSFSTMYIKR